MIQVRHVSGDEYEVKVGGYTETVHRVTLREVDWRRLAGEDMSPADLIEQSFRFLLEREPNTSILREFELPLIAHYFPEYEREIRMRTRK